MKFLLGLAVILLVGRVSCQNISTTLTELGCTDLLAALDATNLTNVLEGLDQVTLFAPTNDAIASAGELPEGEQLVALLTFHAINSSVQSSEITDELTVASINTAVIRFNVYNGGSTYTAQGAPIDLNNVDVAVTNGFIHVVDAVMFPPSVTIYELVSNNPDFSTLKDAIDIAGIIGVINNTDPLTVFAPNNDAFNRVPTDVLDDLLQDPEALAALLTSHAVEDTFFAAGLNDGDALPSMEGSDIDIVINDNGVFITSPEYAQVIGPNVQVTNGVVHEVNRVLNLPVNDTSVEDISQTLADLDCTVLAELLSTTMSDNQTLMQVLESLQNVTLFAPTNDALAAAGDVPEDELVPLLTFHAVAALAGSSDIVDELLLESVNGANIRFNTYNSDSLYTAQGAPIDLANVDVTVTNGFIHVVDAVMFPPSETIYEFVSNNPDFSTLKTAIDAAGIANIIDNTDPLTVFAPNNDAFARVPTDVLEDLLQDPEALAAVLTSHAVGDTYFAAGLNDGDVLPSVEGSDINIVIDDNGVFITSPEYAQVTLPNVQVTNGVVHEVNRVLNLPVNDTSVEDISQTLVDLDCTVLADVLSTTTSGGQSLMEILEGLAEVTLFAPTNEALAAADLPDGNDELVDLLTFHAVAALAGSSDITDELAVESVNGANIRFNIYNSGNLYTAQGAPINLNNVDVTVTNGFIHVVDAVMFPPSETIYELVSNNPDFSSLKAAIDAAGIADIIDNTDPLTVFAPTDAAFARVPTDVLDDLLQDPDALTAILNSHAVGDTYFAAGLNDGDALPSVEGSDIDIVINDDGVFIVAPDYAQVILPNVQVTNGVVHAIDRVLYLPVNDTGVQDISQTLADLDCTVLAELLSTTMSGDQTLMQLLQSLPEVTLFAPTNNALAAAGDVTEEELLNILMFHAVAELAGSSSITDELLLPSGNGANIRFNIYTDDSLYTAQGAPINLNNVDNVVANGLIHVVDAVMFPPTETIYQYVSNNPDFATLKTAIDEAGLADVLNGDGPFTVFAPNDAAFDNVPNDVLADLLGNVDALTDVLLYHTVADTAFSVSLDNNEELSTMQGDNIVIIMNGNGVFINAVDYAQVIATDVPVTNGVVHTINRVLTVDVGPVSSSTTLSISTSIIVTCLLSFLGLTRL